MDNVNYYILTKIINPTRLLLFKDIINFVLLIIFSTVLYYFWQKGKEWAFSFISNINLEYSGIEFILLKIL